MQLRRFRLSVFSNDESQRRATFAAQLKKNDNAENLFCTHRNEPEPKSPHFLDIRVSNVHDLGSPRRTTILIVSPGGAMIDDLI